MLNDTYKDTNYRTYFRCILVVSIIVLFCGVWWGWPGSFDQHDPTTKAIKMLWNRTLDPGIRYWGAFAYQEVLFLAVVPVAILKKFISIDPNLATGLMYLMTRIIWALKGLAIVILTYLTSKALFQNKPAALFAMLLIAVSPGFVAWSHIPQVDIAHAFWYSLAIALTALGWRRADFKLLLFASISAGLTAGVKYIGGIIVIAPMTVVFMLFPTRKAFVYSFLLLSTALFVFFVTTPLVTGSPINWLPEYTADVLANGHREVEKPIAFWTMPFAIWDLIGPGTSIVIALSFFLLLRHKSESDKDPWIILLACFLPYYLCLSWQHVATVRYVVPVTTVMFVAAGFLTSKIMETPQLNPYLKSGIFVAILTQLILTISLVIGFSTDTRVRLAQWLNQNVEPTDIVETTIDHRPYFTEKPSFKVISRPHFQAESYQMQKSKDEDTDSTIRKLHESFIQLAGRDPETFLTWVDRDRIWLNKKAANFDSSIHGPVARGSKYIIINVNTARHYVLDWPGIDPASPNEKEFFRSVMHETGPFKKVMHFEPIVPEWLRYPKELWINVSPTIEVFKVLHSAS